MDLPFPTEPSASFKNRRTGLVVFGVLTVLIGLMCGLFVPLMLFGQLAAQAQGNSAGAPASILPAAVTYGTLAVALVWLGVGSINTRRWARALLLIGAWSLLVVGVMSVGMMAFLMPKLTALVQGSIPPGQPQLPATTLTIALLFAMGTMAVFMVVLPAVYILFYRSPHVRATCEALDPVPRWTDHCPLPVLAVVVWLGVGVPMMLLMPVAYHGVFPFFGTFLTGVLGSLVYVVLAGVWAFCARSLYRLESRGWWILVISGVILLASHVLTYSRHEFTEVYALMGYPAAQVEQMTKLNVFTGHSMAWMPLLFAVPYAGYLLYIRRFLK